MTDLDSGGTRIAYARLAGFLLLFVIFIDVLGMSLAGRLEVAGDIAATAQRILAAEWIYRLGLCCGLVGSLCTVPLAMGLYVALKPVNGNLALLALIFRLVEAALGAAQAMAAFSLLRVYSAVGPHGAFDARQLSVLKGILSSPAGTSIAAVAFSLGSALFFYLFLRSGCIPKALAALGLAASVLVTIVCFGSLVVPAYSTTLQYGWIPMAVAELWAGVWLLWKGVDSRPREL
jgi:hypothetical protein